MLTPRRLSLIARACLFGAMAIAAAATLGPVFTYQSVWLNDSGGLHAVVYYGLATLCFLGFPSVRRNDMAWLLVLFAGILEVAQGAMGRNMHIQSLALSACGVYAVVLPTVVEQLRSLCRVNGWASLPTAWRELDRRRAEATQTAIQAAAKTGGKTASAQPAAAI